MSRPRPDLLPTVFGVLAFVTSYAIVNDQFIAAIAPIHFTIYHPHIFPFQQAWLLALCFSLVATTGPGLAWGFVLYWAAHFGSGPVPRRRVILVGAGMVLFITAVVAWGLGWRVAQTGVLPYSKFFYPIEDDNLNVTQTVQLTNYLVGASGAALWVLAVWVWRIWHMPPVEPAK